MKDSIPGPASFRAVRAGLTLLALLAAVALPAQQPTAVLPSIEGRVARASDRSPIQGATVELIGIEEGRVRSRTQTTRNDGVFRFRDLVAGTAYQIVVTGAGIQATAHGQSNALDPWNPIVLSAGEQLRGVEINPQMLTAIRGKVLDNRGRGIIASVAVMRTSYLAGRRSLEQVATTYTNTRGEYGFSALPIGVYYLRASPRSDSLAAEDYLSNPSDLDRRASEGRSVQKEDPRGYPVSYYPGASLERATAIRLSDGTILENMNFQIEEVQTGRLKGIVYGTSGKPIPGKVLLIPERGAADSNWTRSFRTKDGEFDIRGVLPGSYALLASGVEAAKDLSAQTVVTIANGESKTIEVRLSPRASARGRIAVDDWVGPSKPELQRLVILLIPAEMPAVDSTLLGSVQDVPSARAASDAEGNFTLSNLQPWKYRVVVATLQETAAGLGIAPLRGAYIKSVRLEGRDVLTAGFSVDTASLENLEVTLATTASALDGRVTTPDGEDAALARVVLVPNDRSRTDLYQAATASTTGRFQFQFLAPGSYKAFAWQGSPEGAWFDPEFMKAYENTGTVVEIMPDTATSVDLRIAGP